MMIIDAGDANAIIIQSLKCVKSTHSLHVPVEKSWKQMND